ncbi:hypothetical protein V9K67_19275 [Paraflavisolibacter sp. H34]
MRTTFAAIVLLIATVSTLTSCYASRSKYGCPTNTQYGKFKG